MARGVYAKPEPAMMPLFRTKPYVFALLGSLALAACAADTPTAATAAPRASSAQGEGDDASIYAHIDMNAERASLLAADKGYSAAAAGLNVVDAITNILSEKVAYVGGKPGVIGALLVHTRQEAHDILAANPLNVAASISWTPIKVDVSEDAVNGYTFGYWTITAPGDVKVLGKYLAYWRKENGVWRVAAYKRGGGLTEFGPLTPPAGFESPAYTHYRYFPNTEPATEAQRIMDTDQDFSVLALAPVDSPVGKAFAAYIAPDGANFGGLTDFAWGPAGVLALWGPATGLDWDPVYAEAAESGDLGFSTGVAGALGQPLLGRYITIWKKQPTGEWRFVIDG
jgi:hypothetical protein